MTDNLPPGAASVVEVLAAENSRQLLVARAIRLTENTTLAPDSYERQLLDEFAQGQLTIDEVMERLEPKGPVGLP